MGFSSACQEFFQKKWIKFVFISFLLFILYIRAHILTKNRQPRYRFMENEFYPFINLPLPYGYDALEPNIDTQTMHLHHDRHLQTYIDNLNAALQGHPHLQRLSLTELIENAWRMPGNMQTAIRNNAGGVYNHRFYFDGMQPAAGQAPAGALAKAIDDEFGSLDYFRDAFDRAALSVFGSGYAWLVYDGKRLRIVTTANQNCPLEAGLCPVLTVDVWEHAYYLKHYNVRAGYVSDWRQVLNWKEAEKRFLRRICPS